MADRRAMEPEPVAAHNGAPAPIWQRLRFDARQAAEQEPALASYLAATVLNHDKFAEALCYQLAQKAGGPDISAMAIREIFEEAYGPIPASSPRRSATCRPCSIAIPRRVRHCSPSCSSRASSRCRRIAWATGCGGRAARRWPSSSRAGMSELYGVDIHPAAPIGSGVFIDHATGIVIGETARIGDDVSMLHGVTLGGTGKVFTDRHPKIGNGVLLGAGAKVLGNITVGDEARVGSGSVVLSDVPPRCSVAGVPAKPVGGACMKPAQTMDQKFDIGL